MLSKFLIAGRLFVLAVTCLAFTGASYADDSPSKFKVVPGFSIDSNPDKSLTEAAVKKTSDPLWFACKICVDLGNTTACGGGTPVASENGKTLILTNAHVIERAHKDRPITVTVSGKNYSGRYMDGSEVSATGPGMIKIHGPDLCLVEIDASLGYVDLADAPPEINEPVWSWGYGSTRTPTTRYGLVQQNRFNEPTLVSTMLSVSGDSGSGVFNTYGAMVGVCWGGDNAAGQHYAVSLPTVRTFLGSSHPVMQKLFPRLAARIASHRVASGIANGTLVPVVPSAPAAPPAPAMPPPAAKPPEKPKETLPAPKATPKEAPKVEAKTDPAKVPLASPMPSGDGWKFDPRTGQYWRYAVPANPGVGLAYPALPMQPRGFGLGFNIQAFGGGCDNGQCPLIRRR